MSKTSEFLAGIENFLNSARANEQISAFFDENLAQDLVYQADVAIESKIADIAGALHSIFEFAMNTMKLDGFEGLCDLLSTEENCLWQLDEDLNDLCSDIDENLYYEFMDGDKNFNSDFDLFRQFFEARAL